MKKVNKFREQLERVGMTKEFKNWMNSSVSKIEEFKVGDRILVIKDSEYDTDFFRVGDKGIIRKIYPSLDLSVKFEPGSYNAQQWHVPRDRAKIIK